MLHTQELAKPRLKLLHAFAAIRQPATVKYSINVSVKGFSTSDIGSADVD
jgi:hypothetical protein